MPATKTAGSRAPVIAARLAEAVFLAGDPPRASVLALWHRDGLPGAPATPDGAAGDAALAPIELVLPAGNSVRRRTIDARLVPLHEALPWLVALPAHDGTPPSLAAWAVAARMGTNLVARGRLLPASSPDGWDAWRAGPLDPDDDRRLAGLVEVFPPSAHALAVPGSRPLRIRDPRTMVKAFWDAIADTLARSPAASRVITSPAFGAREPVDVSGLRDWLTASDRGLEEGARPGLRLELPVGALETDAEPDAADEDADAGDEDAVQAAPDRAAEDEPARLVLQLRSHVDPSLVVDAADLWDASGVVLARLGEQAEVDLLLALRRGAQVWPPLRRALDDARPSAIDLDMAEVETLLGPAAADLAGAGFEVLWPSTLTRGALSLRAVVATESPGSVANAGLDLDQICELHWEALLDGVALTPAELDALAEAKRPLVHLRGRWIAADPELLARLRRGPRRVRGGDALAAALGGTVDVDGEQVAVRVEGPLASLAERLRGLDSQRELAEPDGLEGTLRPYQRRGLAWLAEMCALGLGGCLADDMGLGKTIQLIALHLHRHAGGAAAGANAPGGPTLVVCPTSLLGNWQRELRRFAPGVPVRRYHGGERHLEGVAPDEVVLVTYGVVRRDREILSGIEWGLVAADEAQHVKNPFARTARELRAIPAAARLALTGTPVENRLSDLWSLLDWTTPGLLGPLETFRRNVAIPVERNRDPDATERLARLVRPFLLRRRKTDPGIAPELPPKTESDVLVPLTAEQMTLYEAVVREALREIEDAQGIARRGLVLKLLTALKQVANHPAQYLGQRGPLDGRSGKLAALDELLDVIVDEGDSVLVFTQYVQMARLLDAHLAARGIGALFLHGGTTAGKRDEMVARFQDGAAPVFLLSLKAGGTGLNLTRATHVVHYDRWWNPAVEDQATDRAYRIGQDRPVQVHRLVTEGTVEDRVAQLLARKRELADAVVGSGEGWIAELSDDDLADLVSLRRDGWEDDR